MWDIVFIFIICTKSLKYKIIFTKKYLHFNDSDFYVIWKFLLHDFHCMVSFCGFCFYCMAFYSRYCIIRYPIISYYIIRLNPIRLIWLVFCIRLVWQLNLMNHFLYVQNPNGHIKYPFKNLKFLTNIAIVSKPLTIWL